MRRRITAGLVLALAAWLQACASRPRPVQPVIAPTPAEAGVRVQVSGGVLRLDLDDYVAGCVAAELGTPRVGPASADRIREVQAILCRTYAVSSRGRHGRDFDLCSTTHCQVYRTPTDTQADLAARAAATRTRGLVLVHDGRVIRPSYHAHCGGRTSAASQVWPGPQVAYLTSVDDPPCAGGAPWRFAASLDRLGEALRRARVSGFEPPLLDLAVERRDEAGRAALVRLVGSRTTVVRGETLRGAVLDAFGARSLRSTLFSVHRDGASISFEGRGSGHGVGLCQAGAIARAARGDSVAEILGHYFPVARLAHLE